MDGSEPESKRKAYRYDLKQLLQSSGYNIDFVGSKSTGCYYFSDCENAGISGTRDQYLERMLIDGWDERWGVWETDHTPYLDVYQPDVILLSIGTNDITHEPDAIANQRVSAILNQIDMYEVRAQKEVTVFLALIINRKLLANGNQPLNYYTTHQWNLAIKAMAEQRIANGDKIVIVNMEEDAGFNYGYYAGDMCLTDPEGLHPSEIGYSKMASLWHQKFIENYNQAPAVTPIPNQTISEGSSFNTIHLDNYVSDIEDSDQNLTWSFTQVSTTDLNISINSSHVATITPNDPNWNGTQTVIFKVTDRGHAGVGTKFTTDTVVFKVNAVDDPPVITSQSTLATIEDTPFTLKLSDFTITDPDSDPSTFQLLVLPGTDYTVSGPKVTPVANFNGSLTVNTAIRDASNTGPTFQAVISVSSINDAPVFVSQPDITINEDYSYVVDIQNFTINDPDNSTSELTMVLLPGLHYTIENETVYPDSNFNGTLYVESYVHDALEAVSPVFYIDITVNPVNDDPSFVGDPLDSVVINTQYIYSVEVNDPDADNLSITVPVKPDWLIYYPNSKLLAGKPPLNAMYSNNVAISVSDGHSVVLKTFILHVIGGMTAIDQNTAGSFTVYPNPATDHITIRSENFTHDMIFMLYTPDGRNVITEKLVQGNSTLYFNNDLQSGIYIYTIESAGTVVKGKLLIE